MMMMMAVIIVSVFMLCFSTFAAWVIQYLVILQANGDGDTMVMDTVVTVVHFILALQEQIMRLSLPCTSPSSLCFRSEHCIPPSGSVGYHWPGCVSAGAAHRPGCCLSQEDQGEL